MIRDLYDETNPLSIEEYSKKLIGKTFSEVISENNTFITENKSEYLIKKENKNHKGGLGELLEECYFHYKCNNESKPDFPEAGVELKVTPYKINKNKTLSSKERLILTMINYMDVVNEEFETSHMWSKSKLILLVFYLYSKEINNRLDYKINFSKLFTPPKDDIEIIKNDFYTIVNKIKEGKAHELSEGDTLYLGAATKSSDSSKRRKQPFSNIDAKPRAFSFKSSYMTYILNSYIVPNKTTYEPIIKDLNQLNGQTFKEYIINKINSYSGLSDKSLCELLDLKYDNKNKALWSLIGYRILGIKSNKAEEFVKANIIVKSIRINENNKLVESMSFPAFNFLDLLTQSWEESDLFNYFNSTSFLFVIYKQDGDNYILKGSQLWNMPYNDLNNIVSKEWTDVCNIIKNGVVFEKKIDKKGKISFKNNFPKKTSTKVIHVRPHAQKSAYKFKDGTTIGNINKDANELPNGEFMTTQSFWINNSYILNQINKSLLE